MGIYKKYVQVFLGVFLLLSILVSAFNVTVDPFRIFSTPVITNLTDIKGMRPVHKEKSVKPYVFVRGNYQRVLIGSSRIRALDERECFKKGSTFDFSLSAGDIIEKYHTLNFVLENSTAVKEVIIGLDFDGFMKASSESQKIKNNEFIERVNGNWIRFSDWIFYLISLDSVINSVGVISDSIKGYSHSLTVNDLFEGVEKQFIKNSWLFIKNKGYKASRGHEGFDWFGRMINLGVRKEVLIKFVILPTHARSNEYLYELGLIDEYRSWKRLLVDVLEGFDLGDGYSIWDFSGYHAYNSEQVVGVSKGELSRPIYHKESVHMSGKLGEKVLQRMYGLSNDLDFGTLLSNQNLEQVLRDFDQGHQEYSKLNPEEIDDIRSLLGQIERAVGKSRACHLDCVSKI